MTVITQQSNALIIPCATEAKYGGNYGDATAIVKLLAKTSKYLITNQYAVCAGIFSDIPENVLVLEGFMMDRFFAEQIVLRPNIKHRIAVVCDSGASEEQIIATKNAINAARSFYGLDIIEEIFFTDKALKTEELLSISDPYSLLDACQKAINNKATALAIVSCLDEDLTEQSRKKTPNQDYNPLEQIEAKISSLVSRIFLKPCGFAPLLKNLIHENNEALAPHKRIGYSLLPSVFKALQHSPQIIPLPDSYKLFDNYYTDPRKLNLYPDLKDIAVTDLKNLVVPFDACNGTPMIEAYQKHIRLICVKNNITNFSEPATLYSIPHITVENYLEAAGQLINT